MTSTSRSVCFALTLPSLLLSVTAALAAQTPRDTTAIELAAATVARTVVDPHSVFDNRATILKDGPAVREGRRAASIASAMGLAIGSGHSRVDCPLERPESCRLVGDSSVYTLEQPVITGDTAIVRLRHYFRLSLGRHKVGQETRELILARRGYAWTFVRWGAVFSS